MSLDAHEQGVTVSRPGNPKATRKQVLAMAREVVSDDGKTIRMRHYTGEWARWTCMGPTQDALCEQVEEWR